MSEKIVKSGLTKDEAYALGQKLGGERVDEALVEARKAGSVSKADQGEWVDTDWIAWEAYLREHPPIHYAVHHDRVPPPDEVTREWGPEDWYSFEYGTDWEVAEYSHDQRYVVEHPDANGKTEMSLPHTGDRHLPSGGWVAAYGDPANALRHRDHLRANHPPKGKKPKKLIRVRHRSKGHEVEWAEG